MADKNDNVSYDQNPSDVLRLLIGLVLFLFFGLLPRGTVPIVETDLFRLINHLPELASIPLQAGVQLGSLVAVVVLAVVALIMGRRRLALDLFVSGVLAWLLVRGLKSLVDRERPVLLINDVVVRGELPAGLGFPSGHAAVAAALATAAGPYVSQKAGRVLWLLVWVVGLARIYVGAHLPLDVVGGIAFGWAVGATVHLVLGAPSKRPTTEDVKKALETAGVQTANVFTRGADLNTLIGVEFEVQGGRFAGVEECRPCYWMNNAFRDERVEAWLRGRGGLRSHAIVGVMIGHIAPEQELQEMLE